MHIENLWREVPSQLARALDGSSAKFVFRDAIPGIKGYNRLSSYFYWLEAARLILRASVVQAADTPLSQHIKDNSFKQFVFDTGILTALCGIQPSDIYHYSLGRYKGYIAENFVAQELYAAGFQHLCSWHSRTSEIEFLVETPGGAVPLEIKSGWNMRAKSLHIFESRFSPRMSIIFSAKNAGRSENRWTVPIYLARNAAIMLQA